MRRLIYDLAIRREFDRVGRDSRAAKSRQVDIARNARTDRRGEQRSTSSANRARPIRFHPFLRAVTGCGDVGQCRPTSGRGRLGGRVQALIDMTNNWVACINQTSCPVRDRPPWARRRWRPTSLSTSPKLQARHPARREEGTIEGAVVGFYSWKMSGRRRLARVSSKPPNVPREQIAWRH